jgi:hypothetical protein
VAITPITDSAAWATPHTFHNRASLIDQLIELNVLQPAVLVRHRRSGDFGIAIILCENLSRTWQSGDLIFFWDNGDHGDINPEDEVAIIAAVIPLSVIYKKQN